MKKQEISCGAYVFDGENVLLVQHNEGHWDFPKGHIEPGETEEETACREVWEETGIIIEILGKKKYEITYEPKVNIQKRVIYFEAKKVSGEIKKQESEIQQVEWIDKNKVIEKITYENSRNCFKQFLKDKGWI